MICQKYNTYCLGADTNNHLLDKLLRNGRPENEEHVYYLFSTL